MPKYRLLAYRGIGRNSKKAFDHVYDDQQAVQKEIKRLRNAPIDKRVSSIYVNDKRVYPA